MFGVFSRDYTVATVTEPLPYNHQGPTILQCIIYWLQSSLYFPGSFEIPKVSKTIKPDQSPFDIVRQVSAELYSPVPFNFHTTGSMWRRTWRIWRSNIIKELRLDRNLSRYPETKYLVEKCCASLTELGSSPNSPGSREVHLIARCRDIVDQIQPRPTSSLEWSVILTWLAVVLDPITLGHGLQSLEEAFVIAADLHPEHPILQDQAHRKRKSLVDSRRARGKSARILQLNNFLGGGGTWREFYWRHASEEVAIILDRYLPLEIRLQLQRWNLRAQFTWGPRNSYLESQSSRPWSEHRFADTEPPEWRVITGVRSAVAAPWPPPPGPPEPWPRFWIGTPGPAEFYMPWVEDRRRTLRSNCRGRCMNTPYFCDLM